MRKNDKTLFAVLVVGGLMIIGLGVILFMNEDRIETNSRIVEVGQENSGCYCNIEYYDFDKVTPEAVEKNKQKCKEAAAKLFGADKAENVLIRYKKHR
ncbi:hypothetical protein [Succinivibrio dextrinosolvens]|uniref:hypothetical protein n=1 Tax=Succinivibrio dextrinosolvens TaxID=83771 RepID=UPI00192298D3|nr:hypothetical protein [Succinivibrio dextrinosolvens]